MPFLIFPFGKGGDDFFASTFEKSGNYAVKAAYHAIVTQKEHVSLEEGTASRTPRNDH